MHLNKILRLLSLPTLLICSLPAAAQYYYKDILVVDQTNKTQKLYAQEKVTKVTLESFEPDNRKSSDLRASQTLGDNFRKLITVTQTSVSSVSTMTSLFDDNGRLAEVTDSTAGNISKTIYTYSPEGNLERLVITTRSLRDAFEKVEEHIWKYDNKGVPQRMLRILGKDTIQVQIITDNAGRVIEEKTKRTERRIESVYYYYNDAGLISDIVRFNARAGRLLPDYMFEYDEKGRLVQMINVPNAGGNYLTWLYSYDEAGLKSKELAVDKQKQLMGRIEYRYTKAN